MEKFDKHLNQTFYAAVGFILYLVAVGASAIYFEFNIYQDDIIVIFVGFLFLSAFVRALLHAFKLKGDHDGFNY